MERTVDDCTRIEPLALEEEFVRLPGDLAYYSGMYADAYESWLKAKLQRETRYARAYQERKSFLLSTSKGRVTEAEVESEVAQDPDYLEAKAEEIACESEKVRLGGIVDAVKTKRDALISIGAHQRAEWASDPTIRDRTSFGQRG